MIKLKYRHLIKEFYLIEDRKEFLGDILVMEPTIRELIRLDVFG